MKDTKDNFQKLVLPNGLTVLLYKMESVMSAYAELTIRLGAIHERQDERGISHFTEHASLLGTKKFKTKLDIARHAEQIGTSFDGQTNKFATLFWVKLPESNLSEGLELLREFVFRPCLDPEEILRERKVVLSELNDFWGNPERRFWHEFWARRFAEKDHPYGWRSLGKPENIEKFDVEQVKNWRQKYYHPNNMFLTITGDFDLGRINELVNRFFGNEKPGVEVKNPVFDEKGYSNFDIYTQSDDRSQIVFGITFPSFGRKNASRRKIMTLGVLTHILSRGTGSRLFQRLRQKEHLVYSITASSTIHEWLGAIEIQSSVSLGNLMGAIRSIKEEIALLIADGVKEEELDLARKFMNYSTEMRFDNPVDIAYYLSDQEFDYKEIWFPERYIRESEKITRKIVDRMAREIFDFSRINIGILGKIPAKNLDDIKNIFREKP